MCNCVSVSSWPYHTFPFSIYYTCFALSCIRYWDWCFIGVLYDKKKHWTWKLTVLHSNAAKFFTCVSDWTWTYGSFKRLTNMNLDWKHLRISYSSEFLQLILFMSRIKRLNKHKVVDKTSIGKYLAQNMCNNIKYNLD